MSRLISHVTASVSVLRPPCSPRRNILSWFIRRSFTIHPLSCEHHTRATPRYKLDVMIVCKTAGRAITGLFHSTSFPFSLAPIDFFSNTIISLNRSRRILVRFSLSPVSFCIAGKRMWDELQENGRESSWESPHTVTFQVFRSEIETSVHSARVLHFIYISIYVDVLCGGLSHVDANSRPRFFYYGKKKKTRHLEIRAICCAGNSDSFNWNNNLHFSPRLPQPVAITTVPIPNVNYICTHDEHLTANNYELMSCRRVFRIFYIFRFNPNAFEEITFFLPAWQSNSAK